MTTIGTFVKKSCERLSDLYSKEEGTAICVRLLEYFLKVPPYRYISDPKDIIPDDKLSLLLEAVDQLRDARPLQYVLGYTEFAGLKIKVREGVLIPRPETEELVNLAADSCENILDAGESSHKEESYNILDVCTGSGCIAYALASQFPQVQVYACDNSDEAIKIACRQKVKTEGARPVFFYADVLSAPPAGLPMFDMIIANPPYVCEREKQLMRDNVLRYEPSAALFVPDDDPLKYYRAIMEWAKSLLKPSGCIWFEINEAYGEEVRELLVSCGYPSSQVIKDINDKDRFATTLAKI